MKVNEILKAATIEKQELGDQELDAINRYSMRKLVEDDVFVFRVVACGNEVDRDFEVFPRKSLVKLAELMEGKTVIANHNPSTENQKARIYRAEVVDAGGVTKTGEQYAQLVLHCYMARTESNRDQIAEIEAGIKKEVSVGCAVESVVCSICGKDNRKVQCEHRGGTEYGGCLCYKRLENPTDAYEVSFVAIPAQPEAGVTKSYGGTPEEGEQPKTIADLLKAAFTKETEE